MTTGPVEGALMTKALETMGLAKEKALVNVDD